MIVVHDTFRIRFGAAREVRALMQEGLSIVANASNMGDLRVLWNFTGPNYRVLLETSYESLGAYEQELKEGMANSAWQEWYRRLVPYIEKGHRTLYTAG